MKRKTITIAKLTSMLSKGIIKWIPGADDMQPDDLAQANDAIIRLFAPEGCTELQPEGNQCMINTAHKLYIVRGVTEGEYDNLFNLYGWERSTEKESI